MTSMTLTRRCLRRTGYEKRSAARSRAVTAAQRVVRDSEAAVKKVDERGLKG